MDESLGTCNRRMSEAGVTQTEASRRRYRQLLMTAPGLSQSISGAILFDETLHQNTQDGVPFVDVLRTAGILVGIKVDVGAKALAGHPGERVTEGLDGLRERLHHWASQGARFAKWRAVLAIGDGLPSRACIQANAHADRLIARLCAMQGTVVLFSHGQFGAALAVRWIGLALIEGQHLALQSASVSRLGVDPHHPDRRTIESWNEGWRPPSSATP